MVIPRGLKSHMNRTVVLRECGDQSINGIELVQNRQAPTTLSTRNGDQNFMAGFGDINRHQNSFGLCNSGIGQSRSPLRCGLCKTTLWT